MPHRSWLLFVLTAALVLGLAACSSNPPASTSDETAEDSSVAGPQAEGPGETASTSDETGETSTVAGPDGPDAREVAATLGEAAETLPAEVPEIEAPAETVIPVAAPPTPESAFAGALVALEKLESYRYATSFLFVGEEDGETESGSMELKGVIAGPDRMHLTWTNVAERESFEVIQIGDEAWILDDGEWEQVPVFVAEAMSQVALVYAPSVTWGGLFGELEPDSTYVGDEVVNGILTHHYTATYQQWGSYWQGELIDAAGDVWIAEAGYPVRYHFSATGIDEDGDRRGAVTWAMDLTDVNAAITIEPPM